MLLNLTKNSNKKQDFADFIFHNRNIYQKNQSLKNGKVNIQILMPEKKF